MSDTRSGREMTKADVILSKLEQLTRKVGSLESRLAAQKKEKEAAAPAAPSIDAEVIKKLADEHEQLKLEISCVSMQIEGLYTTLSKMISKLPEQVAAKMPETVVAPSGDGAETPAPVITQVVNNPVEFDVDDLASRVAAKIIIPDSGLEDFDAEALAEKINSLSAAPAATAAPADIDYDALGYAVAKRMYIPQAVTEEIDYDKLAKEVTGKMPAVDIDYDALGYAVAKRMFIPQAVAEEFDYDAIADKIAEKMPAPTFTVAAEETAVAAATAEAEPVSVQAEIDYDLLVAKVAEAVSVQEAVSPDYIAARVAEQIIIPQQNVGAQSVDIDVEELSRKVADKIAIPAYEADTALSEAKIAEAVAERLREETTEATPASLEANLDEQALAEGIASRLNFSLSDELIAAAVVKNLSEAIDSDEIADCVAKRVGSISPEQFEITVDDDGCDSLAKAVESKLDYDVIAAAVAEKLNPAFMASSVGEDIDAEELARAISEKLSVNADINEDLLADKAAAVLSNYMPEVDSADIADKVIAGIIPALPSTPVIDSDSIANTVSEKLVIDSDEIANTVSERIVESQENSDYDIVIDEEGLTRITESISEEITKENDERYAKLDGEIEAIKEEYGKRFDKFDGDVEEIKEEYAKRFDKIDDDVAEIKAMLLSGIVVAAGASETATTQVVEEVQPEEELVTVSDLVGEEPVEEEEVEETVEEPVEEVVDEEAVAEEEEAVEEEPEPVEEPDPVIEEIVEEIDENLTDDEIMPDGMEGISGGGVDFANMMKYNRSFIARIIQGTDDQKNYYGQVKTALLSYKKVNSNVAWAAERFNKGRETIARFKIRGKTLCLYLALDPDEYATSVYHHADVSDNKSMHGTPMMVKIKSQLGVKKAIRLIDDMLAKRNGEKHVIAERDYAAMYPYETIEELIEDGLVKDVNKS